MKTILIPVDFSGHSLTTFKYAVMIAGNNKNTKVHIHHSYNDQIASPDPGISSGFDNESFLNMELIEELRTQAQSNMNEFVIKANEYLSDGRIDKIKITSSIEGGDPEWEILNICDDISPDLIVMGTQGNGNKEIFEGSVAKKIMNKAKVPVIAVPAGDKNIQEKIKILYTANNREKDFMKIHLLFTIFKNIPIKVHVVHFHIEGKKDKNAEIINELKAAFEREDNSNFIEFDLIDSNDKDDVIPKYVKEKNINTIAFIAHKSNLFKNLFSHKITKNDFFDLGLPMVAMHE